jgi:hypothetical protein
VAAASTASSLVSATGSPVGCPVRGLYPWIIDRLSFCLAVWAG